ncbi:DUF402 domain-containing protein [Paractinoplanes rishiriensis]|uniref:DUF402 domain-containing protein n=1 Tax=Paractinoplanes rishiriensis TaxID=1050105 RepID=A0A919KAM1_9ACTN|nr:DUF402 domain-containing protein [Actinoplanes rishiriensis]GIE99731.1 hypothetical protein Ari01nite_71960 [Actinoplanes rishiriensis]
MDRFFERGEVILYRRVRNGRVMLAIPMRVVEDSPQHLVLYQAPNTAFKSARNPDGSKVRDFSSWVLTDLVWKGGSLLRLIRPGDWHCVDVEFDSLGDFESWYVNFQTPFQRTARGVDTDDLVVDLVVTADRGYRVKDTDDFRRAVAEGHISADSAAHVEIELARMIERVRRCEEPFVSSTWLTWQPPAGWSSPPSVPPYAGQ